MYALVKKHHKFTTDSILELIGYEVKINKMPIVVFNQKMIDILINEKLIPELDKLVRRILIFLEEDGSSDNAEFLLGELERLHSLYINKYERYLSKEGNAHFMKNMRVLANELKQIIYGKKISKVASVTVSKGKSR